MHVACFSSDALRFRRALGEGGRPVNPSAIFCSRGRQVRDLERVTDKNADTLHCFKEVEPHESGHCSRRGIPRL
jgi:hypothetical protein